MMTTVSYALTPQGLEQFKQLHHKAVETITAQFYAAHGAEYTRFGDRGRKACREDIEFHLDFLRPVLELGDLQPYTDYLRWFDEVLTARHIPTEHVAETLRQLGDFFLDRIGGADGARISAALTTAATESLQGAEPGAASVVEKWPEQDRFEAALLNGDRRQAIEIVSQLIKAGQSLIEIDVFLIQAALVSIGLKWQKNQVSVTQEHLATATAQTVMADSFSKSAFPPLNGKRVLLACIEGNEHAVGLRMVSDAFELDGWNVQYLGANAPTRALIEQVTDWKPDLVGLSISFPHQLSGTREAIMQMRTQLGDACPPIMIGAAAVNHFPALAQCIGADAHASDALAALRHPLNS
jgi:methanogenic corrinoid protein MtbC1